MTITHGSILESLAEQDRVVVDDVSWVDYERLLEEIENRPIRVTYFEGRMEVMSPLPKHEKWKKRIARLVELFSLERDIEMATLGSTTFKQELKRAGLEPDECYYVQHAAAVRDKDRLDLTTDPPPDLAVEVDIFSRSIRREPVYRALGVPELWRFDGRKLHFLRLDPARGYAPIDRSIAFPTLTTAELQRWLDRLSTERENTVLREFQSWAREMT